MEYNHQDLNNLIGRFKYTSIYQKDEREIPKQSISKH